MLIWSNFDVYSHLQASYSQHFYHGLPGGLLGDLHAFWDPSLTSPRCF